MKILITGVSGFIGFHLSKILLKNTNHNIIGIDNLNDYYPVTLKYDRLKELGVEEEFLRYNYPIESHIYPNFKFLRIDITDDAHLNSLFQEHRFDYVIHLAAQAGVRYSIDNPHAYIESNIKGFLNILEACRNFPVKHLVYASSSSVYGQNSKQPFSTLDRVDTPVSLYAVTKRSNELMAYSYSSLYNIATTGLRFFTVYGPWGRPDMAPMLFAKAMLSNQPINVFNNGELERDFTYIDDIVNGICRIIDFIPQINKEGIRYSIYNIGNSKPIKLLDFINILENQLGVEAIKNMLPMQDGDVKSTFADVTELKRDIDYSPSTPLEFGIQEFAYWYKEYYKKIK